MKKKIFTVATAHLDTVWNWTLETTIDEYIKKTLQTNFDYFKKYPDYKFNFEGAYRYELMEEYYPEEFKKLKEYIKQQKWYPCGSSYENGDVNVPSPEALFRNILLGNRYFSKKFGVRSKDIYLPDCFGFGWALPAIMEHANLKGFVTQKLSWGSTYGVPFDLGKWYGSNGKYVYGALNMGGYTFSLGEENVQKFIDKKIESNEKISMDFTTCFHGVGDRGGAPREKSVAFLQKSINDKENKYRYISARSDEVFDYMDENKDKLTLPEHKNELLLTYHGAGGYTSRAIGKRWNKRNEILGDLCERANVIAEVLGKKEYPQDRITCHWKRTIMHQFHDDLPGTSLQVVYKRSWNDYIVSLNGFSDEYVGGAKAVINDMDTTGEGIAVVVSNMYAFSKTAVVKVTVPLLASFVKVVAPNGEEVPSQVLEVKEEGTTILFEGTVPAFGYKKYAVCASNEGYKNDDLILSQNTLDNKKYHVELDRNGDICSIFDKENGRELLKKPIQLDIIPYLGSKAYPAWEIPYDACLNRNIERAKFVSSEVVENGPARITLKVKQKYKTSVFYQYISLTASGKTVDVRVEADWRNYCRLVKHSFSLTTRNEKATYDLGLGTIQRGNNKKMLYEVPAQNWADLTDKDGSFGVSILSECKFGWDKPFDNTLRLTALQTPYYSFSGKKSRQDKLEIGLNRYSFSIFSHAGEVGKQTQTESDKFLAPMPCFVCDSHEGNLGQELSFASLSDDGIQLKAMKKAEDGEEIIIRLYEGENKKHENVTFTLGKGIIKGREVFASEEAKCPATVQDGKLVFCMEPYEVKTFALTVQKEKIREEKQVCVTLKGDKVTTTNSERNARVIKNTSYSIPQELWCSKLTVGGTKFELKDAVLCNGQTILLPSGAKTVSIVMASLTGKKQATFVLDGKETKFFVSGAQEKVGSWDLIDLKQTAKINTDTVAYEFTHTHSAGGDNIAKQFYLYRYDLPSVCGAKELTLPTDEDIVIFGITAKEADTVCKLNDYLFDTVEERKCDYKGRTMDVIRTFLEKKHEGK